MRELIVKEQEAGQRLDKFLHKYLKEAPTSFLYKMIRKKNIVVNGRKVTGSEQIKEGDIIKLFLSEETIEKFTARVATTDITAPYQRAYSTLKGIQIVSEFEDVLFLNKPAGILSQKADDKDISANEWLIGYLLASHAITTETLKTFKPSVCNRLDRNTSGLLVCSKTLPGSREMARLLKDRSLHKYYRCVVKGTCKLEGIYEAFLYKNEKQNKVFIYENWEEVPKTLRNKIKPIKTGIKAIAYKDNLTELEIRLFTGKTHQIRAQMEKLGYPLLGDVKYSGDDTLSKAVYQKKQTDISRNINSFRAAESKLPGQFLHAYRLVFPEMQGKLAYLSGKEIICPKPETFF